VAILPEDREADGHEQTGSSGCAGRNRSNDLVAVGHRDGVVAAMCMEPTVGSFFFDVCHFTARRDVPIAADHAATSQRLEPE
jgi:hypothetical protein